MIDHCIKKILSFCYPARCLLCEAPGEHGNDLCRECHADLPLNSRYCRHCALPLPETGTDPEICGECRNQPPIFRSLTAPYLYQPPMDELIGNFKTARKLVYGRLLGTLLAEPLRTSMRHRPQCLIPVPADPARLRERGFNPAGELARQLSRALAIPWRHDLLLRTRSAVPQRSLPRRQRLKNVRRCFRCKAPGSLSHVALIDDVVTTGATVAAASRALADAGIAQVDVWAVARTLRT